MYLQLPINIKRLIRLDLHLPNPLTRCHTLSLINWRLKLITPRTPPTIPIPIVVAAQEVPLRLRAFLYCERDIHRL